MPAPTTPSQFCNAVPSANADLCTRFTRFLNIAQLLCDLIGWMFNEDGTLSQEFSTDVASQLLPPGTVMYSLSTSMGEGWLLADGSEVSRTVYANLFTAVGTRYGDGDGSTTFTLPDLRGRSLIGAGQGNGLTNRDINAVNVGEERHLQTVAEMPAHTHGFNGPVSRVAIRATSVNQTCWQGTQAENTDSAGGGQAFNVVHPSVIGYAFVKT